MSPHPLCAVCKKPVQSLSQYPDRATGALTLVAECHGKAEEVVLHPEELDLYHQRRLRISFGTAFVHTEPVPIAPEQDSPSPT